MAWLGPHECVSRQNSIAVSLDVLDSWKQLFQSQEGVSLGYQAFDPKSGNFLFEGEWQELVGASNSLLIAVPSEDGRYQFWVSLVSAIEGWAYERNAPFLLINAQVSGGIATLATQRVTTLRALRARLLPMALLRLIAAPFLTIGGNWSLIRAMVRRDILGRYRGSFGDSAWTILQPLLLMSTYFFVFGIVLESKHEGDKTRAGYALFFLSGMLPWLSFSEAIGRAPFVVWEHRNFVKKLVFPVEILPVNLALSGLITGSLAYVVYLFIMMAAKEHLPWAMVWLPTLIIPQLLFTVGLGWIMAAAGVFIRDLGQINGFLMTLWFFLTPICYTDKALPQSLMPMFRRNPMYAFVRGYRLIFLEDRPPEFEPLLKVWMFALFLFFFGHWMFKKLKKDFPDIV